MADKTSQEHPPIVCRAMAFYWTRRAEVFADDARERERCLANIAVWREREKAAEAMPPGSVYQYPGRSTRDELVSTIVRDVCELPDRTSPEGQPDMITLNVDELIDILETHL